MFGSIGTGEILVLLVLALVVLGPEKLPGIARTIGRGLAELRRASYDLQRTLTMEADDSLPSHRVPPDKEAIARLRARTAVGTETTEPGSSVSKTAGPEEEPPKATESPIELPVADESSDEPTPSRAAGEQKPAERPSSTDDERGGI